MKLNLYIDGNIGHRYERINVNLIVTEGTFKCTETYPLSFGRTKEGKLKFYACLFSGLSTCFPTICLPF